MEWVIASFVAAWAFTARRLLRYLRYLQQEEYEIGRFLNWVWENKAFDRRGTVIAFVAICLSYFSNWMGLACAAVSWLVVSFYEENPCRLGKIRLQMTARAKRILAMSLVIYTLMSVVALYGTFYQPIAWCTACALLFQTTPLFLSLGCYVLRGHERYLQQYFLIQAQQLVRKYDPFVIGITGSYGKTSVKHALGHILQASLGPTFWPGKSINTVMGITREIRTNLEPWQQWAVIEMAAYYEGSIRKLCELTPPKAAIITGIGLAHLERYKTQDAIERAKSELAQALGPDAILVCNGDNEGACRIAKKYATSRTYLYGLSENCNLDCRISNMKTVKDGTQFTLHWKGKTYDGFTPQYGRASLSNLAGAFTMAVTLGAQPDYVMGVLRSLEPVSNRLQVTQENGTTYLRDAYNSNPDGFATALEVLAAYPANRRILMTPGMIELGHEQEAQNKRLAVMAASICHLVLVVGSTNKQAIVDGLKQGGMSAECIVCCENREQAFAKLQDCIGPGDAVLIENDLTDLYELPPRF